MGHSVSLFGPGSLPSPITEFPHYLLFQPFPLMGVKWQTLAERLHCFNFLLRCILG